MPVTDKIVDGYRGFKVVSGLVNGSYEGRATNRLMDQKLSAKADSPDSVLASLRQQIDAVIDQDPESWQETRIAAHKNFMEEQGKTYKGVVTLRSFKVSHCYMCKTHVDSSSDLGCAQCRWIICSSCAACGCGYGGGR